MAARACASTNARCCFYESLRKDYPAEIECVHRTNTGIVTATRKSQLELSRDLITTCVAEKAS